MKKQADGDMSTGKTRLDDAERHEYVYINNGKEYLVPYRLFIPGGEKKKRPLVLYMHGFGECGSENEKQLRILGGRNLLLERIAESGECIILAPQCRGVPPENAWVDIGNVWNTGSRSELGEPTAPMAAVCSLIKEFAMSDDVDKDRIYLVGLSMGGYAAWELMARLPGLFAAAVPLCGAGFPELADRIKHIPVWAFHGAEDTTVPPVGTHDMEKALKAAGGNVKATYLEGYGHNIWDPSFGTPGLFEWLLSQKKGK